MQIIFTPQTADVISAMERDSGIKISRLAVDGGASRNDFLMGFQADISGCTVARPAHAESTALGAAYLAGLCAGVYTGVDALKNRRSDVKLFEPKMGEGERLDLLSGWKSAVAKARLKE